MNNEFMMEAIRLSRTGMENGEGGPFGCVIVKDGKIISRGNNKVTSTNDPTAHAEVVAIRQACQTLNSFQLEGCEIYTSCEPCPMCLGAIYWARPVAVYYACSRQDAALIGFDDQFIYDEMNVDLHERHIPMHQILQEEAVKVFNDWTDHEGRVRY